MADELCASPAAYELCFCSLRGDCADLRFPCDADGVVPLDQLSSAHRLAYLWARAAIGWAFHRPFARPAACAAAA